MPLVEPTRSVLTFEEVAEILKTSPHNLRWWRQHGTSPDLFKIGKRHYIHIADQRTWIRPQRLASQPVVSRPNVMSAIDDPRHIFLSMGKVMARYGWGNTKGYQNLKDRILIPPSVVTHPDRWRLDQLLAWEEKRIALAEAALEALLAPDREELRVNDLLPQPKRRRRVG